MRLYVPQNEIENARVAVWMGVKLGVTFSPPYLALGIISNGTVTGAVLLNGFDGANIELTGVGARCFTVPVVRELSRYIFWQLKCARVTLRTRRSNRHARKLLGRHFKFETTLKNWYGDEDAYQFRMCRDECPWLERKNEYAAAAAAA